MITQQPDTRLPVTLLTGFLGAGKTTLLNHLIRDPGAGRIAVVMNEYGDIGLDHDLIEEATEETVLLQSGCLCCSILGDLAKTLAALAEKRRLGTLQFDRVVIETSGIADPGPILHTLIVDPNIAAAYRMDGVVTLADAATGASIFDEQSEAVQQVAMADAVILTKTDLATPAQLAAFEARLEGLNAAARRIRADHGRVPQGALFGLTAMLQNVTCDEVTDWLGLAASQATRNAPDPLANLSGFAAPKPAASLGFTPTASAQSDLRGRHERRITSASIEITDPIPARVFDFWLETLVAIKGPDILRMKGIVHVEGIPVPFAFHGVQHFFDAPVPLETWTGTDKTSRVVVIARDMSEDDLESSLQLLRLQAAEAVSAANVSPGMMGHTTEQPF